MMEKDLVKEFMRSFGEEMAPYLAMHIKKVIVDSSGRGFKIRLLRIDTPSMFEVTVMMEILTNSGKSVLTVTYGFEGRGRDVLFPFEVKVFAHDTNDSYKKSFKAQSTLLDGFDHIAKTTAEEIGKHGHVF